MDFNDDINSVSEANSNPYAKKKCKDSPQNRILKQGTSGEDWMLKSEGDDNLVELLYGANITSEVRQFKV